MRKFGIKKEFARLTGIVPRFSQNLVTDRKLRGNYIFDALGEKVFDHPRLLVLLKKKIKGWLKEENSVFTLALAGYIYYIDEAYGKAERFFLQALEKNRENLDLWFDLAFCLYHQGLRKQETAKNIIFNHVELAQNYKGRMKPDKIDKWLAAKSFPLQDIKI